MSPKLPVRYFCIFFPWSKFEHKAYPCVNPMGLWQVAEQKKKHIPHEHNLMNCDESVGFLNVFHNSYNDPDKISLLINQQ